MAIFQLFGMVVLFNDISSSVARLGVVESPLNFRISPGSPSGPTYVFLPNFPNLILIILVLIIKVSPELANFISEMLRSQQKTDA